MQKKNKNPIRRFYAELVRRRVQRTLGGFAVCAVSVLTAADLILPTLPVPEATYDLIVAFFVLALPIVVYVSWTFDFTFDGVTRTPSLDEEKQTNDQDEKRIWVVRPQPQAQADFLQSGTSASTGMNYKSVAILPFINESKDQEGDYLSDGITETIINKLAKVSGLKVTPRASAFRYKGTKKEIPEIGQELGVDAIVTGLVKQFGERLLVQAEITDVVNQNQIWGEHFNGLWENLFDVQEEIASDISNSLKPELTGEELKKISHRETDKIEAYQEYLRGRYSWNKRTEDGLTSAITHFRAAI